MTDVSKRDLRNHGGDVIDRVLAGESLTVTKAGKPVAELRPLPASSRLNAVALLERWKHLPKVNSELLRRDIDESIDSSI